MIPHPSSGSGSTPVPAFAPPGTGEPRKFVLSDQATFGDYGLGSRFPKWEVNLVFDALVPDFVTRHIGVPVYGWAQVSPMEILLFRYLVLKKE